MGSTPAQLLRNRHLGASALLAEFIRLASGMSASERSQFIVDLQQSFPLMAVWFFADDFFSNHPHGEESCQALSGVIEKDRREMLGKAHKHLSQYQRFATLSRSSLVEAALCSLPHADHFSVVCSRSLPAEEGLDLERTLRQSSIPVQCVSDWELEQALSHVDVVVLGADWVSGEEFINKWGSRRLCEEAAARDIPVVIVAEHFKQRPAVSWPLDTFYQDWGSLKWQRRIQVFERCPLGPGIHLI